MKTTLEKYKLLHMKESVLNNLLLEAALAGLETTAYYSIILMIYYNNISLTNTYIFCTVIIIEIRAVHRSVPKHYHPGPCISVPSS